MCGRFALAITGEAVAASMGAAPLLPAFVEALAAWQGRFNIAPTTTIPVVTAAADGGREISFMRWGLVPFWAKAMNIGASLNNARSDSIASKPAFREAWKRRRCLVPATSFYEWQVQESGTKQPYAIASAHGEVLAFAGIWERWRDPQGGSTAPELISVAIITTDANETMRPLHHRMPVIIAEPHRDEWLRATVPPVELLRPCDADVLRTWRVSSVVNNARNDRPECLTPLP